MAYECKVYDKNGKLKKILRESQLTKSSEEFFNQRSTKKVSSFINNLKEPATSIKKGTKFYNKTCIVCQKEFHPRHPNSKYCSHECQKILYLAKKKREIPVNFSGVGSSSGFQSLEMSKKENWGAGISRLILKIVNH